MAYANYREIPHLVRDLVVFKGNSCRAEIWNDTYIIYSYSTPIYKYDLATGEERFDYGYYSPTTTRLQNIIKFAREIELTTRQKKRFRELITTGQEEESDLQREFDNLKENWV